MTPIRKNSFVRQIMSKVQGTDPYLAVGGLVAKYRRPGETLETVAKNLGVQSVAVEPMGFDGGVFEDGSVLQIKLNSSSPPTRRRFTLAHEVAHLILAAGGARSGHRSHAATELEQACDLVAAELLMPLDEVRCVVPREGSIEALLTLGNRFEASLHAAAIRIHQLGLWKDSVGFWKWDGSARELWFVGRRPWPDKSPYLDAFARAMTEGGTVTAAELIREPDRDAFHVCLKVRRLGREFLIAVLHKRGTCEDCRTCAVDN